ncbi:Sca4 family protein [Candidatus Tisiphia endosymbiont of Sialis lutaria]|uniref:Sca4 family protein n=1 Tax=Candidatus Tisiphia endosymbiont of Sialis lutaria TaxID=2029164 RepID=UPI00312C735D
MSLPEPTEILSKIAQFQAEITNEQNIFDEANRVRKLLQEDIENKQIELESLKEHWQEQDNDALKSLTKLWQQQEGIKRQLSDWSENGIKKAIEEQTTTLKTQLNEIESKYKGIRTEISAREKFNLFLQGNIDLMDRDTIAEFSQLVGEGDKQKLLKENSQDIAALNAMITDLEKEHESLTKQEQKLKDYSLADNLAYDTELQKLFEERQTDITKKIDNIVSQQDDSELKKQYENVKLQEEEIKLIQNQIEEKNQIIKQTKQKKEELFTKLEQLQQESSIPPFHPKQEGEEIVNQYPILQERANDIAASIERQIELNKLNDLIKQQGEEIDIEKDRADSLAQQLEKLTLSTNKEIEGNLIVIKELQENIKRLEKKERQFIIPQGSSWADELKEGGEPSEFVQLEDQIGELTKKNDDLKANLEALGVLSAEKDEKLKVAEEGYKKELSKQLAQTAIDVAKLQVENEKLSNLQTQLTSEQQEKQKELEGKQEIVERLQESLSVESNHSKELQTQVDKLATDNSKLQDEINVAEEKHKEEFSKQLVQTAIDAAKLQVVNDALLQGVIGELSQLKSEQQGRQEELEGKQQELNKSQEELVGAIEELNKTKELYGEKSNQAENLQTQVGELTNAQQQFTTKLEEAEKNAKNQLETLSAEKDLVYNELKVKKDSLENELDKQSKVAAEQAQENRKNASRITELESQNAALLAQLASLNVKVETSAVGIQTDEVLSNTMKSVGTGTEPVMGSGVSTKEAMTNTTEVIIQQQTVSPLIERQTIDRVLVHDNDDDKILWAFKKLSRDQVQPIIDKCGLESGSNFAKFAKEDFKKLSEVFQDTQILRDIENIEQKSYADIHKEFASEYKDIIWQGKDAEKSFSLQQNGNDVAIISEKKLSYDNDVEYKTSDGESIKNVRTVNIPLSMDIKGSCHMSFAVQDTNGRNISKESAVYLTAHYNNGKLVHLTKPTEIFACSGDKNSPLYLKRDGNIYTLPVNKYALEQLEKEVLKNKGEYVGIVKNASGDIISINSGASQEGRSERLKDDASFKIASQVLHANATHTTNSLIDRKVLPKKHSQYTNRSV